MKAIHIAAVVICTSMLATVVVAEDQATSSLVEEVRCVELAFAHSVEQGDRKAFARFLAGDARFVGEQLLRGREEILQAWDPFLDADYPRLNWRPEIVEILADGELALSRGPYLLIVRNSQGSLIEHWGYYNSVWHRDADGHWRIQVDMGQPHAGDVPHDVRERVESPVEELLNLCANGG